MTITTLKEQQLIIFECVSGSRAYGLNVASSDTDIKGVFILPQDKIYGLEYVSQVADDRNDIVYYELGRFLELLKKNNPNILELLATPEENVLIKHPVMERMKTVNFLSKKCKDTFGGYAFSQVKKARGLNKKIANPMKKEKKLILDFCYVLNGHGSIPLSQWLKETERLQAQIGLVNIPHFKDTYALYYDAKNELGYDGVMKKTMATSVLLSSIPKEEKLISYLQFNQEGYIKYCKDYRAYWDWVEKRNEHRYESNIDHGKNYDAKNMMHTFRLLDMAYEILTEGKIIVKRPNREELLSIRNGGWLYEDLMEKAAEKMERIEQAYLNCDLPADTDETAIEKLLVEMRRELYKV